MKGTLQRPPQGVLVSWVATPSDATPHSHESPPLESVGLCSRAFATAQVEELHSQEVISCALQGRKRTKSHSKA